MLWFFLGVAVGAALGLVWVRREQAKNTQQNEALRLERQASESALHGQQVQTEGILEQLATLAAQQTPSDFATLSTALLDHAARILGASQVALLRLDRRTLRVE